MDELKLIIFEKIISTSKFKKYILPFCEFVIPHEECCVIPIFQEYSACLLI